MRHASKSLGYHDLKTQIIYYEHLRSIACLLSLVLFVFLTVVVIVLYGSRQSSFRSDPPFLPHAL